MATLGIGEFQRTLNVNPKQTEKRPSQADTRKFCACRKGGTSYIYTIQVVMTEVSQVREKETVDRKLFNHVASENKLRNKPANAGYF